MTASPVCPCDWYKRVTFQVVGAMASALQTSTSLLEGLFDPANDEVWREFDARYRPIVFAFARKLGLDNEDAADVTQETLLRFLQEYRSGKYIRERGRLSSWIVSMVRFRAADLGRSQARRGSWRGQSGLHDLPAEQECATLWLEARRTTILRQAVSELYQHSKMARKTLRAFELLVLQEHPAEQVARDLGMSLGSVYMAKNRVAEKLREIVARLEQLYDEDT